MASEKVQIRYESVNKEKFIRDNQDIRRSLEALGRDGSASSQKLKRSVEQAGEGVKKLKFNLQDLRGVGVGLTAIGAVGVVATKGILSLAGSLEQAEIGFTTLLGSAEKAQVLLADLTAFAAKTPFTIPGIRDNARQLLAVGFAAEEIIPTLKSVGDVAAGLGLQEDGLRRLIINLGQVRTQGKLTGRELRDFAVNGVPLLEVLADSLGKTKAEVQDLISQGKISAEQVEAAFEKMAGAGGKFANLTEKQNKSLIGQFSNLKDNVIQLGESLGTILLPIALRVTQALISISEKVKKFAEENKGLTRAIVLLGAALTALTVTGGPLLILASTIPSIVKGFAALKAGALLLSGVSAPFVALASAAAAAGVGLGVFVSKALEVNKTNAILDDFVEGLGLSAEGLKSAQQAIRGGFIATNADFTEAADSVKKKLVDLENQTGISTAAIQSDFDGVDFSRNSGELRKIIDQTAVFSKNAEAVAASITGLLTQEGLAFDDFVSAALNAKEAGIDISDSLILGIVEKQLEARVAAGGITEAAAAEMLKVAAQNQRNLFAAGAALVGQFISGFSSSFSKFANSISGVFKGISPNLNLGGLEGLTDLIPGAGQVKQIGSAFAGLSSPITEFINSIENVKEGVEEVAGAAEGFEAVGSGSGKAKTEFEDLEKQLEKIIAGYDELAGGVSGDLAKLQTAHTQRIGKINDELGSVSRNLREVDESIRSISAGAVIDQAGLIIDQERKIAEIQERIAKSKDSGVSGGESGKTSSALEEQLRREQTALGFFNDSVKQSANTQRNELQVALDETADKLSQIDQLIEQSVSKRRKIALAGSKEQLVSELEEQKQALEEFNSGVGSLEAALAEERRRASLTEFERRVEDINARKELELSEAEAKKEALSLRIQELESEKEAENAIFSQKKAALESLKNETEKLNVQIVESFRAASSGATAEVQKIITQITRLKSALGGLRRGAGGAGVPSIRSELEGRGGQDTVIGGSSSEQTNNVTISVSQQPGQDSAGLAREIEARFVDGLKNLQNNNR